MFAIGVNTHNCNYDEYWFSSTAFSDLTPVDSQAGAEFIPTIPFRPAVLPFRASKPKMPDRSSGKAEFIPKIAYGS
jgi:hypothetical protein